MQGSTFKSILASLLVAAFGGHWTFAAQPSLTDIPVPGAAISLSNGLGVKIEAAMRSTANQTLSVRGRVRSEAQCGLAASRTIRVDALDETGLVRWSGYSRIVANRPVRHSRLKHTGTFEVVLPGWAANAPLRIGVVSTDSAPHSVPPALASK